MHRWCWKQDCERKKKTQEGEGEAFQCVYTCVCTAVIAWQLQGHLTCVTAAARVCHLCFTAILRRSSLVCMCGCICLILVIPRSSTVSQHWSDCLSLQCHAVLTAHAPSQPHNVHLTVNAAIEPKPQPALHQKHNRMVTWQYVENILYTVMMGKYAESARWLSYRSR